MEKVCVILAIIKFGLENKTEKTTEQNTEKKTQTILGQNIFTILLG